MSKSGESLLRNSTVDILVLLVISALLSIDITRLGNLYSIDTGIFPYYNYEVQYKYWVIALYNYNPWLGTISTFDVSNFLIYFPVYIFSHLPCSSVFYEFFLMSFGLIFTYKLITDMLPYDNEFLSRLAGYSGALFFVLNPQGAGGLTDVMYISVYIYSFTPFLIYSIRKYFLEQNFLKAAFWLLVTIPVFLFVYYTSIPYYVLPLAILLLLIFLFYSAQAIRLRRYVRVVIPLIFLSLILSIELNNILSIYNSFINPDFIKVSYYFWVNNAKLEGLALTLRGINMINGMPPLNIYYFTLLVVLVYSFVLIADKTRNAEPIFIFSSLLLFTFLYSMPNVPFSSFWENLFFELPIMADLRSQYVLITPFQGLLMSISFGLGSYYFMRSLFLRRSLKIVSVTLIFLVITGTGLNILVYGSPFIVHIPHEFLEVSNFINPNASYNSTVLILPIFGTENSESWYHGPSLFSLFLKPFPILGGYYYSASRETREIVNIVYYNIYSGNTSNTSINYIRNFFYLFNVKYVIVEKTARPYIYLTIFSPKGLYSYHEFESGLINFTKYNVIKLKINNSMYLVYSTGINSSIGFIAYENYSIDYLLKSDNISKLLIPIQVIYVSPAEYIIKIPERLLNQSSIYYLYLMIPYNKGWNLSGTIVLSHTNYYGYNVFKIKIENSTIYLINLEVNNSLKPGITKVLIMFILPIALALMLLKLNNKLKEFRFRKILEYL